ncbi:hypothetical protein [Blastopirellula marina]|uniref:Glutamine amidotransferase domain-containing protein n=1 Tax=Blastopirellula marina TaxID=124 RepID=A0A2S8GEA2_9BACT|nr:hypothetical protein [Blastopirellula marina]PQO42788.1 hypothetical protein C5Y98_01135 [Blastopirellula marina]PTL46554.1 hypothetical protein C5Y97_01135 [Blastopirellula marina]
MRSLSYNFTCCTLVASCLFALACLVSSPAIFAAEETSLEQLPAESGFWVANEHQVEQLSVELGIAGRFKLGSWTEVRLSLPASSFEAQPNVSVIALDSDGVPVEIKAPLPETVDGKFRYRVPVKIGRRSSNLQIQFVTGEPGSTKTTIREIPVLELAEPIQATQRWYLQIGPDMGLAGALQRYGSRLGDTTVLVPLVDPSQLPKDWYQMEGVDLVIWTANDTAFVDRFESSQLAALHEWLKLGGRMVLSVGSAAADVIAETKPLARFVPGKFDRVTEVRDTTELEALVGREARIDRAVGGEITVAVLKETIGVSRVVEGSRQASYPLWVRSAVGFGTVDFFGFDFTAEPIASWDGREPLLKILLEDISDRQDETQGSTQSGSSVAHFGYTDIAGQLRMALDQFPGVRNVSFFMIGAILVVYLALIGPGDYFFLRRFNIRMEWTWVTFPMVILLASFGIWSLATWSKGTALKMNHVEVLDVDMASRMVRSTSWFHLFSPDTKRYDVTIQPNHIPVTAWNQLESWQGLAGSGLGGMSARQSISTVPTPYSIDFAGGDVTDASLEQLPIQIWSSKTLMGRGWGEMDEIESEPLNERESELIDGLLHNPTDMTLTDCYVFHGRWAYFVPKLPANGSARIVPGQSVQNTEKVLKRRRVQELASGDALWDRQSTDVARIMEVAMFYNAAGGPGFTNLSNRFQSYVDLTSHTQGDRAVLVGKVETPPLQIQIDGAPNAAGDSQAWSYVRIVYPVQRRSDSEIAQR